MHVSQDSHLWSEGEAPKLALPPAALGKPDAEIAKLVADVSEENVTAILKKLESFQTRNTMSEPTQPDRGIGAARQWIFDQFKSYSPRLEVSFDTHQIPKGGRVWKDVELRNVVAILPGKQDPDRWIIVSGHYDSLNLKVPPGSRAWTEQTTELPAPGVSDDGSGTACAMEAARVLSQHEFRATLVFVAFAGEEQGLIGSRAMAKRVKAKNQEIEAVLNNDIIGNDVSGNGTSVKDRVLVFSDDPADSPSRQIARYVASTALEYFPEMHADTIFRRDRFGRGGDQTSFNAEGYAGVRFTTASENFTNQHSPTDTLANASTSYTTKVIRVNVASAASLASAPRPPLTRAPSVELRNRPGLTRGTGYDAAMRWQQPHPDDDLAGFLVTTRSTTAPQWGVSRAMGNGNVHQFTMKDVPIDQLVFGVKAVDRAGHESPASAYSLPPFLTGGSAD